MGPDLRQLILGVVTSWQVIAITLVIIGFIILVIGASHIGEGGKRDITLIAKRNRAKKKKAPVPVPKPSKDDDLGIEEE